MFYFQNIIEETAKDGLKTIKYATTPLMSSYLVAFAVGEFEYIEVINFYLFE